MESNCILKLKKKLQSLKSSIKHWLAKDNPNLNENKQNIQNRLIVMDKILDQGRCNDDLIQERSNLLKELQDFNKASSLDMAQKAKIRWAIEGDENSKFYHGIINKKHTQLAILGVLVEGDWIVDPSMIKRAVWDCGISKSPGPDGFTFELYHKYWNLIDHDVVAAVTAFFSTSSFPPECNSSFIALIPKSQEAKMVKDFDSELFSDVQSAFNLSNLSTIVNVLKWFHLASGLKINLHKSKLMGIGIPNNGVALAARLSKWNLKTLSIGGRLTLIKFVLSSLPLYYMSSFKVPKDVLSKMEYICRNFFNGVENREKKMSLICWNKILVSKKNGSLCVSSFFAFNHAILFKWIWRFIDNGSSLWSRFISAIYGVRGALNNSSFYSRHSPWLNIVNEVRKLFIKGIDLISIVKKKVGNGEATSI
nr:RNA-directed DNA polymerase, eukaryota [Tanacetum cinerariifolium]